MHICFFRPRRTRKLLVIPKRSLAIPAALVCIFALCLLVNLPASVTTAAAERQLPIYCVQRDEKVCSLSFDAAWGNEDTRTLIDILDRYGVKATFFVVGQWAEKYPESVKALAEASHEVMCHSDDHAHFNTLSAQEIIDDVNACCDKIEAITGRRPALFRPPVGEYDDHVVATLRGMGLEVIQWDVEALAAGAMPRPARAKRRTEGMRRAVLSGSPPLYIGNRSRLLPRYGAAAPAHFPIPRRAVPPRLGFFGISPQKIIEKPGKPCYNL